MLSMSKPTLIRILTAVLGFAICGLATTAQTAQKDSKKSNGITVTGCLQKGDEADEFAITGSDGKNYELVSSSVKLSAHVGHKVSVTGALIGEKNEENEKKEEGEGWSGKIRVASLKMIAESCK